MIRALLPLAALLSLAAPAAAAERHATGTFAAKTAPVAEADTLGRLSVTKTFTGGLIGTGTGEMLTAGHGNSDGAYVLIERVTGKLHGRAGRFSLVHRGIMTAGKPDLLVTIVPGSGADGLAGIAGRFTIIIDADGTHRYDLAYTLP